MLLAHNIGAAVIVAGYVGKYLEFGPLLIPGQTICYNCYIAERAFKSPLTLDPELAALSKQLCAYQLTASLGPVTAISASFTALEIIKYLTDTPEPMSIATCHMMNIQRFEHLQKQFYPNPDCDYCTPIKSVLSTLYP